MTAFGKGVPPSAARGAMIALGIAAMMTWSGLAFAGVVSSSDDQIDRATPLIAAPPVPSAPLDDEAPSDLRPAPLRLGPAPLPSGTPPSRAKATMTLSPLDDMPLMAAPAAPPVSDREPALATRGPAGRQSGDSLRQVLRSLTTVYQAVPAPRGNAAAAQRRSYDDPDEGALGLVDISDLILESEIAGRAVRELVDVKSSDGLGTTFSILGFGDFKVETRSGAHGATVSELSTGQSVTLAGNGSSASRAGDAERRADADADPQARTTDGVLLAIRWVLDFLFSPLGILLTMTVMVVALLWGGVRSMAALQRRAVSLRAQYRGGDVPHPAVKSDRR